jgi:putative DNA primase/helicase
VAAADSTGRLTFVELFLLGKMQATPNLLAAGVDAGNWLVCSCLTMALVGNLCHRNYNIAQLLLQIKPPYSKEQRSMTIERSQNPMTDLGNGERFAQKYGHKVRWCEVWKKWLIYDGACWQQDDGRQIRIGAKKVVMAMYGEAEKLTDDDERKKMGKWAIHSESTGAMKAMLESAKAELLAAPKQFDAQPFLLNCKNCVVDLQTGDWYGHDPNFYMTKCADAEYDPDANCPTWKKFLAAIFDNEQPLIDFVQQALGMSLAGNTQEQKFFLCYGIGSNGKTTLLEVIRRILGTYAVAANIETFMVRKNEGIGNDLAELCGARFVTAAENKLGSRLNEAAIKKVTGGEPIRARFLYGNEFQYQPEFTLWVAVNHKPVIKDTTKSIWRRVMFVPFEVVFEEHASDPAKKIDPDLLEKLLQERDGILAWLVEGCVQWVQQGQLNPPQKVVKAISEYQKEMNTLEHFLEEQCVEDTGARVQAGILYKEYRKWCEDYGERADTLTAMGLKLTEMGYGKIKSDGRTYYRGIATREDAAEREMVGEEEEASVGS